MYGNLVEENIEGRRSMGEGSMVAKVPLREVNATGGILKRWR